MTKYQINKKNGKPYAVFEQPESLCELIEIS